MNYLVGGQKVTDYLEGGYSYEVHIRAAAPFRTDASGIGQLTVPANPSITATSTSSDASSTGTASASSSGGATSVPLNQVVDFKRSLGPTEIDRYNRRRQITISANVAPGASEAKVGQAIQNAVQNLKLSSDYTLTASGTSREQQRTNAAFIQALTLSFIFMYLILAAQFESWLHPVTILLTLPLTVPFALVSLLIFGQSLNIFSLLGILVLFGVVKKNAILQIDHTNQLCDKGMNRLGRDCRRQPRPLAPDFDDDFGVRGRHDSAGFFERSRKRNQSRHWNRDFRRTNSVAFADAFGGSRHLFAVR